MAPPPPPASPLARIGLPIRLAISATALILVGGAYQLFFYSDLANAIANAQSKYSQLQNDEAAAAAVYRLYLEDSAKLEEKKVRARDLNKVLPETTEMASFLATVNQQADIAGLKVKSIVPGEEQAQPFYARVPVQLVVAGRFHQLAKFVAGIGRQDRIINIENIDIGNPKVVENDELQVQAKCLATTFRAVRPAASSSASAAPAASQHPPR